MSETQPPAGAEGSSDADEAEGGGRSAVAERSCLFLEESGSTCGDASEEHIIQKCVGGTWASKGILCLTCNNLLGSELDPALDETFGRIISRLAPLMPGKLKLRTREVPSSDGRFRIKESAGGVAELARVQTVPGPDGTPKVFGPERSKGDVRRRLDALGQTDQPLMEGLLLDIVDGPMPSTIPMDDRLRRAAFKSVLETLDICGAYEGLDFARRPELATARQFVRTGAMSGHLARFGFPFIPLTEEVQGAFDAYAKAGTSWNRVLVSYDRDARVVFGLLQVASTMPLGVVLARDVAWPEPSMTFLYGKSLVASEPASVRIVSRTLPITWEQYRWAEMPPFRSRQSAEFGIGKVLETFRTQLGRVQFRLDQDLDEPLGTTLELTARVERQRGPADAAAVVGRTCRRVLDGRFTNNGIPTPSWRSIEMRAGEMVEQGVPVDSATRREELLRICRALERDLLAEFGLPQPHLLTPEIVEHLQAR